MELPTELVKNIFNYLTSQPYKDVAHLVSGILMAQDAEAKAEAEKQKELPLV